MSGWNEDLNVYTENLEWNLTSEKMPKRTGIYLLIDSNGLMLPGSWEYYDFKALFEDCTLDSEIDHLRWYETGKPITDEDMEKLAKSGRVYFWAVHLNPLWTCRDMLRKPIWDSDSPLILLRKPPRYWAKFPIGPSEWEA